MAEAIASDLLGKLLGYLGQSAFEKIAPYFEHRDKVKELKETMEMIQARLFDAERRREDEEGFAIKLWLKRLKRVLYKLEDLFEEVDMADRQTSPVCLLTFDCDSLKLNKKVSQDVKAIMGDLERIKSDLVGFNLSVHVANEQHALTRFSDRETYSYISEKEVFGRRSDKEAIVEMLLDSNQEGENVSVIPLYGMGGIGKTTLAKLCFNDENVERHFELKAWACISVICSLKELVKKILVSISSESYNDKMMMEELQIHLRRVVNDKRYLLVLDDVWDENPMIWLDLKSLLSSGKKGSKVIVTTRSLIVADIMGTYKPYQLGELTEKESWALFESLAFKGKERNPKLINIGREIVKKCVNVPLVIRTVASLLYSNHTSQEWEYFRDTELRMIAENDIMSTLKLSYDYLPSHLKQCFAYCSLFPKDYELQKEHLIWLWISQDFVRLLENQSLEDAGDKCFMELLRRCFFQDVTRDKKGSIVGCKMHDLFHDLAYKMGDECQLMGSLVDKLRNENMKHVSLYKSSMEPTSWVLATKEIRSMVVLDYCYTTIEAMNEICSRFRRLRALDLGYAFIESIPNSIGKLKQLRYIRLKLWTNKFKIIPDSITSLASLQIFCLQGENLKVQLPKGLSKLTRLRRFIIKELTSNLPKLMFVVGKNNGLSELGELLNDFTGNLTIKFEKRQMIKYRNAHRDVASEGVERNLKANKLSSFNLDWRWIKGDWGRNHNELHTLLPKLVSLKITKCKRCQYLPSFGQLPLLKHLSLVNLGDLEYIENWGTSDKRATPSTCVASYYPSLESLTLEGLHELKRWSRGVEEDQSLMLSCLYELFIIDCPELISIPLVPRLLSFMGDRVHGKLIDLLLNKDEAIATSTSELKEVDIVKVYKLNSLSINLLSLESLCIWSCNELINMTARSPMSLRCLKISGGRKLKDLSGALQHLANLEELEIWDCEELEWGEISIGNTLNTSPPWQCLKCLYKLSLKNIKKVKSLLIGLDCVTTLQYLCIRDCHQLRALPESIGHLTHLRELQLWDCPKLTLLPDSFQNLANLQSLWIRKCPRLQTRGKQPDGVDFSLVQHVPSIRID